MTTASDCENDLVVRKTPMSLGTPSPRTSANVVSLIFKSKDCDATPHSNGRRRRRPYFACCRARKPPFLKDRPRPLFPAAAAAAAATAAAAVSFSSLYPSNAPPSHSLRSLVLFLVLSPFKVRTQCFLPPQ